MLLCASVCEAQAALAATSGAARAAESAAAAAAASEGFGSCSLLQHGAVALPQGAAPELRRPPPVNFLEDASSIREDAMPVGRAPVRVTPSPGPAQAAGQPEELALLQEQPQRQEPGLESRGHFALAEEVVGAGAQGAAATAIGSGVLASGVAVKRHKSQHPGISAVGVAVLALMFALLLGMGCFLAQLFWVDMTGRRTVAFDVEDAPEGGALQSFAPRKVQHLSSSRQARPAAAKRTDAPQTGDAVPTLSLNSGDEVVEFCG